MPSIMNPHSRTGAQPYWAIVLAGGNGSRMSRSIRKWLGEDRPKQYCAFVGSRTMLQHTIDRVSSIVPPERIMVVIQSEQRRFFDEAVQPGFAGKVIEQPSDCGTMPAIYAAVAHILVRSPSATVLLSPSDHYIGAEMRYAQSMAHGLRLAERYGDQVFLLGVSADHAETEYGWIVPGEKLSLWDRDCPGPAPFIVKRFREKPSPQEAQQLFEARCLWNSLSLAAKASSLWLLGWRILPRVMPRFETYLRTISAIERGNLGDSYRVMALERLYRRLDVVDFSKDILEKAQDWCSVLPLDQVDWSDWGRPERVRETLLRLNRQPTIPFECLEAPGFATTTSAWQRTPALLGTQRSSRRWHSLPRGATKDDVHPPCTQ
jgi:mannose-1-phosphate guanylyltransferase